MLSIELKNTKGEHIGFLDFPERPDEVRLEQYIDFQAAYKKYDSFLKSFSSDILTKKDEIQAMKLRLDCVSAFTGRDLSFLPIGYTGEAFNSSNTSIMQLFAAIWQTMSQYKQRENFENFSFEYDGKTWTIPASYRDAITNQERFAQVATAQAVEALEAWRVYESVSKEDATGGYYFKTVLNIIACFAKTESDVFPDTDDGIAQFVNDRIVYFKGVDMQTALDVVNFFFFTPSPYMEINDLLTSLIRQNVSRLVNMN